MLGKADDYSVPGAGLGSGWDATNAADWSTGGGDWGVAQAPDADYAVPQTGGNEWGEAAPVDDWGTTPAPAAEPEAEWGAPAGNEWGAPAANEWGQGNYQGGGYGGAGY